MRKIKVLFAAFLILTIISCQKDKKTPFADVKEHPPVDNLQNQSKLSNRTIVTYDSDFLSATLVQPTKWGVDTYACKVSFIKDLYYKEKNVEACFNRIDGPQSDPICFSFVGDKDIWVDPGVYQLVVKHADDSVAIAANLSQIGFSYQCKLNRKK